MNRLHRGERIARSVVAMGLIACLPVACVVTPEARTMTAQSSLHPFPAASAVDVPSHDAYFQFMLAVEHELSDDVNGAAEKYARVLELDPSSPYLHGKLAEIHAGNKDHDEALLHVDAALRHPDIDVKTQTSLADVLANIGLFARAIALYDTVIQRDRDNHEVNHEVFVKKGVLLLGLNELDAAEEALQRSIDLRPDLPSAYYHLGRVALGRHEPEHAIAYFERAIAAKQDFLPAYLALAKVHEEQGNIPQAIRVYDTTLKASHAHAPWLRAELIRLYLKEKSYAPALVLLEDILHEDPHNLEAILRVGLINVEQQQFEEAAARLRAVLDQRPNDVMVRDYLGLVFEQSGAYDEAIEQYVNVLKMNAEYLDSLFHLGHLYYRLKQFDAAVTPLRKAVGLDPQRIDVSLVLGVSLSHLKRYQEAAVVLEGALAQNAGVADLHYHLGIIHDKLDREEDFIARMQEAIRLDPNHAEALNYLGYSYVEQGINLPEAMGLIERAVSLQPDNGYYLDSLAWGHFKMGRVQDALVGLKQATSLAPDDAVIIQHLGEVYLTLGRREEARKAWLRSLELNPDNQALRETFQFRGLGDSRANGGM